MADANVDSYLDMCTSAELAEEKGLPNNQQYKGRIVRNITKAMNFAFSMILLYRGLEVLSHYLCL